MDEPLPCLVPEDIPLRPRGRPSRRSALLSAATRVMATRGIRDMTLEEVSSATGLTRGAIYWHFVSKERLVDEVLAANHLPLEALTQRPHEDPCQTLARAINECLAEESLRRFCQILVFNAGEPSVRLRSDRIHRSVMRFMVRHCLPRRGLDAPARQRGLSLQLGQRLVLGVLVECVLAGEPGGVDQELIASALRRLLTDEPYRAGVNTSVSQTTDS